MDRVVPVAIAVATIAVYMSSNMGLATSSTKRQGDASDVAALEVLVQQQAATIDDLRARLDAHVSLLVGCFTSQQHASVSQGRICSDNVTCCHTEILSISPSHSILTPGRPVPALTI